jgi:hypothetical protein
MILGAVRKMDAGYADATTGSAAMDKSSSIVRALDLRIKLAGQGYVDGDSLPSVDDLLGMIAERLHCNCQIGNLIQSPRAWTVLKTGILAKVVGVDVEKVRKLAEEVESTFKLRLEEGRQSRPERSVPELLNEIATNTITNPGSVKSARENDEEPESPFEGKKPATDEAIAELEKRLNISLPDDYKEFLKVSNGFGRTWGGVLMDPPLHPTSHVRWFEDDEQYFIDLTMDLGDSGIYYATEKYPDLDDELTDKVPTVGKAIEIGTKDIDNVWLLPPANVEKFRVVYLNILNAGNCPPELKKKTISAIDSFAGSIENFKKLDWFTITWAAGGSASMEIFPNFKTFLVAKATASAEDRFPSDDENHEQKCFSYSCR